MALIVGYFLILTFTLGASWPSVALLPKPRRCWCFIQHTASVALTKCQINTTANPILDLSITIRNSRLKFPLFIFYLTVSLYSRNLFLLTARFCNASLAKFIPLRYQACIQSVSLAVGHQKCCLCHSFVSYLFGNVNNKEVDICKPRNHISTGPGDAMRLDLLQLQLLTHGGSVALSIQHLQP